MKSVSWISDKLLPKCQSGEVSKGQLLFFSIDMEGVNVFETCFYFEERQEFVSLTDLGMTVD